MTNNRALTAPGCSIFHDELGSLTVLTVEEQGGSLAAICCPVGEESDSNAPAFILPAWVEWDPGNNRWHA